MSSTIRLDDGLKDRLEQLARATNRSKTFLASEAICALDDSNAWQVAQV